MPHNQAAAALAQVGIELAQTIEKKGLALASALVIGRLEHGRIEYKDRDHDLAVRQR